MICHKRANTMTQILIYQQRHTAIVLVQFILFSGLAGSMWGAVLGPKGRIQSGLFVSQNFSKKQTKQPKLIYLESIIAVNNCSFAKLVFSVMCQRRNQYILLLSFFISMQDSVWAHTHIHTHILLNYSQHQHSKIFSV